MGNFQGAGQQRDLAVGRDPAGGTCPGAEAPPTSPKTCPWPLGLRSLCSSAFCCLQASGFTQHSTKCSEAPAPPQASRKVPAEEVRVSVLRCLVLQKELSLSPMVSAFSWHRQLPVEGPDYVRGLCCPTESRGATEVPTLVFLLRPHVHRGVGEWVWTEAQGCTRTPSPCEHPATQGMDTVTHLRAPAPSPAQLGAAAPKPSLPSPSAPPRGPTGPGCSSQHRPHQHVYYLLTEQQLC